MVYYTLNYINLIINGLIMKLQLRLPLPFYKNNSNALMTMNVYRNAHFRQQAAFKRKYGDICSEALKLASHECSFTYIKLAYELHIKPTKGSPIKSNPYRGSKPKNIDLSNVLSIVDKTFCDSLQKENLISDDTIEFVQSVHYEVNPWATEEFVLVTITEVKPKEDFRLQMYANETQMLYEAA